MERSPMQSENHTKIIKNLVLLKGTLDPNEVLDYMVQEGVFSWRDCDRLKNEFLTKERRTHKFLDCLFNRGKKAYDVFLAALVAANYTELANKIQETKLTVHGQEVANALKPSQRTSSPITTSRMIGQKADHLNAKGLDRTKMNADDIDKVLSNKISLKQDLNPNIIVPYMVAKGVFDQDDRDKITKSKPNRIDRVNIFISILCNRGQRAYKTFLDALDTNGYEILLKKLKQTRTTKHRQRAALTSNRHVVYGQRATNAVLKGKPILQTKLIEIYKERIKDVQVSPWCNKVTVPIGSLYTNLVIVEQTSGKEVTLCSHKEIFYKDKKRLENIYVLGSAGKGKTTWCGQITNAWCRAHEQRMHAERKDDKLETMRNFEYLFLIQLRFISRSMSMYEAICSTILASYGYLHDTVKDVFENPDKCLIICDGLDEYCDVMFPSRDNLNGCTILTTVSPWKFEEIRQCQLYKPDIVLQLKGLDAKGVSELTKTIMSTYKVEGYEVLQKKCLEDIERAGLSTTVEDPIILTFLVHLWNKKKELSKSLTKNMINIIAFILQGENNLTETESFKEIEHRPEQKLLPGVLEDKQELKMYGNLILSIAKLAFEGLIAEEKKKSLVFRGDKLDTYFECNPGDKDVCFKSGLLSKSEVFSAETKATEVSFHHKLSQEFFGAIWVVYLSEASEKLCNFCLSLDGLCEICNIYAFLCGIYPVVGAKFSEHVAKLVYSNQEVLQWRKNMVKVDVSHSVAKWMVVNEKCLHEIEHCMIKSEQILYNMPDLYVVNELPRNMEYILRHTMKTVTNMFLNNVRLSITEWDALVQVMGGSNSLKKVTLDTIDVRKDKRNRKAETHYSDVDISPETALQELQLLNLQTPLSALSPLLHIAKNTAGNRKTRTQGTLQRMDLSLLTISYTDWKLLREMLDETNSLQALGFARVDIKGDRREDDFNLGEINVSSEYAGLRNVRGNILELLTYISGVNRPVPKNALTHIELNDVEVSERHWNKLCNIVCSSNSLITLVLTNISITSRCDVSALWRRMTNIIEASPSLVNVTLDKNVKADVTFNQIWREDTCRNDHSAVLLRRTDREVGGD